MKQLKLLFIAGILASLFGCSQKEGSSALTTPVENIQVTKEQKERRARSEEYCRSKGIPVYKNQNPLFVESDEAVTIRTKDEVVDRTLALYYIGLESDGFDPIQLDKIFKDYKIFEKLTENEKTFVATKQPTGQQTSDIDWRYESLHVMLWSLGFIDTLGYADCRSLVSYDVGIVYKLSEQQFRKQAKLRSKEEILDQADLILRLHWACVNASIKNESAPGGLISGVVSERHYSFNWLIRYLNQDWDNVTTDT